MSILQHHTLKISSQLLIESYFHLLGACEMPLASRQQSGFLALHYQPHGTVLSAALSCDTSKISSCLGDAKLHKFTLSLKCDLFSQAGPVLGPLGNVHGVCLRSFSNKCSYCILSKSHLKRLSFPLKKSSVSGLRGTH